MSGNKQYGLITKKTAQPLAQKHAVFGEDTDSDNSDKGSTDWVKKALKRDSEKSVVKRQTKIELQRALEQDATVFQYDEVYDQLEQKKQDSSQSKSKDKKPRYIQQLLHTAERRKIENERRIERQVQKEREEEGEEFKDKETFVTSAYKKKLEEFAKLDEEQKRQDMLEEIGDVTKQQDISGFYRHLYQTTVANNNDKNEGKYSEMTDAALGKTKEPKGDKKDSRHYRKRKNSASSEDKNKDADSDMSSSSSSSSSSSVSESESDDEKSSESETEIPKRKKSKDGVPAVSLEVEHSHAEVKPLLNNEVENEVELYEPKIPERSIWEKRTVGLVYEEALKRYYERKNSRLTAVH